MTADDHTDMADLRDECATLRAELEEARAEQVSILIEQERAEALFAEARAERDAYRKVVEAARAWQAAGGPGQSSGLLSPTWAERDLDEAVDALPKEA